MDQIESKQRFHYEHKHLIKFIIGMEQFTQLTIRFHDFETRQELNNILNCAQICQITKIFNQKSEISIWTKTFLMNFLNLL